MYNLKDKNYFITGGSRGIGAGIVQYLAHSGAKVHFTYTSKPDRAEALLSELPGEGHCIYQMDISQEESVEKTFKEYFSSGLSLDGLVNNAGITRDQILLRMKPSDFDSVVQTNLRGCFLCTKAVLKPLVKARSGSIVNITSVIGQTGNSGQANYAASKAGIEAFSKSVAQEVGSRNIRVNCIAPGFIETDMTESLEDRQKEAILSGVPMNSLGQVQDIAHAVGFLLSEHSRYITGQTLAVNGGLHM